MNPIISLKTRRFNLTTGETTTERDSKHVYSNTELDLDKTALILIDVWDWHPVGGFMKRMASHAKQKIVPLIGLARRHNMIIVHCPHEFPKGIVDGCNPIPGERVIHTGTELHKYLGGCGVKTLLYAGYAVNWCVFHRPEGIISMRHIGYNIILLRDCTLAFETPESLEGEWALKMAVNMVEFQWGCTTTLDDLRVALEC